MPIDVACPTCEKRFTVADRLAGKVVRCSHCDDKFAVPVRDRERGPSRSSRSRPDRPRRDREPDDAPDGIPGFPIMLGIIVAVAVLMVGAILVLVLSRDRPALDPIVAVQPQPGPNPFVNRDKDRAPSKPPIQIPPVPNPPLQNPPVRKPPIQDGLIGYWSCDEGQGNMAADFCQRSPATLHGAKWATGKRGGGLEFDGISAYGDLGQSPSLNFKAGDDITLSAWVKTDDSDGPILLFRNSNDGGPILAVGVAHGIIGGCIREDNGEGAGPRPLLNGKNIADNRWHHVRLTRDSAADRMSLFLDGQLQESKPARENSAAGSITTNLRVLGCERYRELKKQNTPEFLHLRGTIDEVCLYKRLLTEAEIQDLLAAKAPPGTPANRTDR